MARDTRFDHIRTHLIRGKRFAIRWRRPHATGKKSKGKITLGSCDSPSDKGRTMFISPETRDPQLLLGTVIHETLHGSCFDLDEDAVTEYEQALMRLLRRMGIEVSFNPLARKR